MTAIWEKIESGWKTLVAAGLPDEAALHRLVEDAAELLPLSGGSRLTVVGREVPIGPWYADLVAVEPDSRVAIIEIKLAKNSEARRAVVAQVLSYAAFLRGMGRETFERDLVRPYLHAKGWPTLAEAVRVTTQDASLDADALMSSRTSTRRNALAGEQASGSPNAPAPTCRYKSRAGSPRVDQGNA